ncbi:MAG: hypothetical protein KC652_11995 [Cyanobacteria bacterium HKST-UBA01]|nr:hypothetical protein [Cyanobacteria bacterium HKST-UBA01]
MINRIMTVGDSISQAFRVCRRDLKLLVSLLLVPTIFLVLGKAATTWGAHEYASLMKQGKVVTDCLVAFGTIGVGTLVTYFALFWLLLRQLGYTRMILLGSDDLAAETKVVAGQKWKILAYIFFSIFSFFFWCFAMGLVLGVFIAAARVLHMPELLAGGFALVMVFVTVVALIAFLLPLVLMFIVVAVETPGFFATISRSYSMSFRNLFRVLGFFLLSYVAITTVNLALLAPYQIFFLIGFIKSWSSGADQIASSPLLTMPLYLQMIAAAWQSCITIYLYPVYLLSAGNFYYSIRMKEEGVDMLKDIERLSEARSA